jgi:hypothetical protein
MGTINTLTFKHRGRYNRVQIPGLNRTACFLSLPFSRGNHLAPVENPKRK